MADAKHASSYAMDNTELSATMAQHLKTSDSFREREFYRYYHPSNLPTPEQYRPSLPPGHTPPNASDGTTSEEKDPIPADDKALTAFAQLGALRLNARRCMISFFDRKNCYSMAEATRSLSLQTGTSLDPADQLTWGQTVYPKGDGVCHHTIQLPMMRKLSEHGTVTDATLFMVNDLSLDERFKDKSFVVGKPYARFYAGVPIRSPHGYNIGSYCIMDDKPRDSISSAELAFMHDMAITVMRHLEMIKIKEHHRRGGAMVRSLGCFVQGKDTLEDWWQDPCHPRSAQSDEQSRSKGVPGLPYDSSRETSIDAQEQFMDSKMHSRNASTTATSVAESHSDYHMQIRPLIPTAQHDPSAQETLQEKVLAPNVKSTFTRAAHIILEATEVDGVVFFDASIGTFGGLVEETLDPEALTEMQDWQYDGETPTAERFDPLSHTKPSESSHFGEDKPCGVLGSAIALHPYMFDDRYSVKEKVLRNLLRHYPRGHIFSFDEHGQTSDELSDHALNLQNQPTSLKAPQSSSKAASHHKHLLRDEKILHDIFPEARSLALCPLWDSHRSRWFAGAILWSTDPMRIFTVEQELSYLTAFGNSIMAEVARLDTTMADQAKADFISSISHELRSPLHGILGSCELLAETTCDPFQVNMTETIETCGKTLLDTISHVLDFAKINNLEQSKSTNDIMSLVTDVDLSTVAEEVLETVFTGYNFQKSASIALSPPEGSAVAIPNETFNIQHAISGSPAGGPLTMSQSQADDRVAVIVDINKADNWVFQTQAGAWRRILMNLFGNALKYTAKGFIKVKVEVTPTPSNVLADTSDLRLVITDSGRGMSPEYIRDRLFHSFAQENPLSQGTGLGLSIVRQIVDTLGGKIDVQSELYKGTKITVSCRLKNVLPSPGSPPSALDTPTSNAVGRSNGMKVAFVGFDEVTSPGSFVPAPGKFKKGSVVTIVKKALESICRDWYGMALVPWNGPKASLPDLFVSTESGAATLRSRFSTIYQPQGMAKPPVIVLCKAASPSHSGSNNVELAPYEQIFEYVAQPCGPRKFGKALSACLSRHASYLADENIQHTVAKAENTQNRTNAAHSKLPSSSKGLEQDGSPLNSIVSVDAAVRNDAPAEVVQNAHIENIRPPIPQSQSSPSLIGPGRINIPEPPPNHFPLSILAVDDNPINLNLLRHWTLRLSHKPVTATNGADAVAKYKAHSISTTTVAPTPSATSSAQPPRFDAVLMDINMPEIDGMEATRQIRAHECELGLKPAKIIALTGLASAQAQQEAFSSGIDMFLTKPIRQRELEDALRDLGIGSVDEDVEPTAGRADEATEHD